MDLTAHAQTPGNFKRLDTPWPLRGSEAFEIDSQAVGDRMAVGVWAHPGSSPDGAIGQGAPLDVIYVLDGSFVLGVAASICSLLMADRIDPGFQPVLLVGVDYPVGRPNARSRDYTMKGSVPQSMSTLLGLTPQTMPGGADNFLKFLETELDPFIRSTYHTTNKPAGIIGDSFGGTFTFYAFLKQSKLFDRYWLGSPGLFPTPENYVTQFEALLKRKTIHRAKMFLTMGSKEMAGGIDFYEDIGRSFNQLVSALERNPVDTLTWKSKVYDGYTHTSVLVPALNDALMYLFKD